MIGGGRRWDSDLDFRGSNSVSCSRCFVLQASLLVCGAQPRLWHDDSFDVLRLPSPEASREPCGLLLRLGATSELLQIALVICCPQEG